MIENGQRFLRIFLLAEILPHYQNDINVVGIRLGRDVAANRRGTQRIAENDPDRSYLSVPMRPLRLNSMY